jgi:ABC-type nickel/cobalt efflux system permease component RcnA
MSTKGSRSKSGRKDAFRVLWISLIAIGMMLISNPCSAHPMGNFSVSHYTGITIERGSLVLRYLIDMAEIPTFQDMQQSGITARSDDPKLLSYLTAKSSEFAAGLHVTVDGHEVALRPISQNVIFPPGAGGLPTMKFAFLYRARIAESCKLGACQVNYEDSNFPGRAGWKEIVVKTGRDIVIASSTAPDHDRSSQLSNYPTDLVSPPQALQARVTFSTAVVPLTTSSVSGSATRTSSSTVRAANPTGNTTVAIMPRSALPASAHSPDQDMVSIAPNQQKTPRSAFTELIARQQMGIGIGLLAALIAAGLGALHALEPGHGKTIVAAYLVGVKGTARHAFLVGIIVTITHTAGVYLLGSITLYAQKYILPEMLYPFLGVLSGILIAGMGFYLFLQRYVGGDLGHSHTNSAGSRSHAGLSYSRVPTAATTNEALLEGEWIAQKSRSSIPTRQLLVLGITGGIVPCPAALVVLLSALALHRVLLGLFLITAFSSGLALVLIAMGMTAVYAGRVMSRLRTEGPLIQRWLPMTSAAMVTALGCVIAVRGLITAGILQIHV